LKGETKTTVRRKRPKTKGRHIPLTCGYCGEDLRLFTKKGKLSRGRIIEKTNHSITLKIKCPSCKYYQQFRRASPRMGKWGWDRIDLPFDPSSLLQRRDERDRVRIDIPKEKDK
jgi:ribosomal protein S27E